MKESEAGTQRRRRIAVLVGAAVLALAAAGVTAVVYDEVGLHPDCLNHLSWLGTHIQAGRYVKAHEVAWALADWEV